MDALYETISSIGGATSSIQELKTTAKCYAYKHVVTSGQQTLTTLSLNCWQVGEHVIDGALKEELETFVQPTNTISNGAISITNDGTNIKLINSAQSDWDYQYATFTSYVDYGEGGGGDIPSS